MSRVLVCGGRTFSRKADLWLLLDERHGRDPISCLISGMATGADTAAAEWATANGVPLAAYPAKWELFGKAAGSRRNTKMLREGRPDIVLACPGGNGTADMVRKAERAKVPVVQVLA